ncbi:hypothetical protein [Oceanobacillus indicireducens]|uniref:Phage protein n=1 Tax=Oceanobacillus indicireducens TaxID=1004261 RepID=A0A917Y098_9BACI|nr:hypothetical protein [Oceanobacillus indicireducens]GGN59286.1 hypothetical protein GCM10007971_22230 [Oceanobacillus indicireducens]
MKIKIRNIDLEKVIIFLENENFKGLKSVNRSKLTNYLSEQLETVVAGERTIREDGKDKPKQWLEQELKAYFDETVTVEGSNMLKPLNVVKAKIKELTSEECEQEFSGDDAYALSVLYDAFNLDEGEDVNESDNNGN